MRDTLNSQNDYSNSPPSSVVVDPHYQPKVSVPKIEDTLKSGIDSAEKLLLISPDSRHRRLGDPNDSSSSRDLSDPNFRKQWLGGTKREKDFELKQNEEVAVFLNDFATMPTLSSVHNDLKDLSDALMLSPEPKVLSHRLTSFLDVCRAASILSLSRHDACPTKTDFIALRDDVDIKLGHVKNPDFASSHRPSAKQNLLLNTMYSQRSRSFSLQTKVEKSLNIREQLEGMREKSMNISGGIKEPGTSASKSGVGSTVSGISSAVSGISSTVSGIGTSVSGIGSGGPGFWSPPTLALKREAESSRSWLVLGNGVAVVHGSAFSVARSFTSDDFYKSFGERASAAGRRAFGSPASAAGKAATRRYSDTSRAFGAQMPPSQIVHRFPGTDNVVRVKYAHVSENTVQRMFQQIVVLPLEDDGENVAVVYGDVDKAQLPFDVNKIQFHRFGPEITVLDSRTEQGCFLIVSFFLLELLSVSIYPSTHPAATVPLPQSASSAARSVFSDAADNGSHNSHVLGGCRSQQQQAPTTMPLDRQRRPHAGDRSACPGDANTHERREDTQTDWTACREPTLESAAPAASAPAASAPAASAPAASAPAAPKPEPVPPPPCPPGCVTCYECSPTHSLLHSLSLPPPPPPPPSIRRVPFPRTAPTSPSSHALLWRVLPASSSARRSRRSRCPCLSICRVSSTRLFFFRHRDKQELQACRRGDRRSPRCERPAATNGARCMQVACLFVGATPVSVLLLSSTSSTPRTSKRHPKVIEGHQANIAATWPSTRRRSGGA